MDALHESLLFVFVIKQIHSEMQRHSKIGFLDFFERNKKSSKWYLVLRREQWLNTAMASISGLSYLHNPWATTHPGYGADNEVKSSRTGRRRILGLRCGLRAWGFRQILQIWCVRGKLTLNVLRLYFGKLSVTFPPPNESSFSTLIKLRYIRINT